MSSTMATLTSHLDQSLRLGHSFCPNEVGVYDDHEAENNTSSPDSWTAIDSPDIQDDGSVSVVDGIDYSSALSDASRGVKDATHREYIRLSDNFVLWSVEGNHIPSGFDIFGEATPQNVPQLICWWIMQAADHVNPDGTPVSPGSRRVTYSYAMRMRAALTYRFGRLASRGNQEWVQGENGRWKGNPSLSLQVSRYMVSLRRRKAQDGETTMSSRAITTSVLRDLYRFNVRKENWDLTSSPPAASRALGPRARRLLQAAYTVSFLCLLRFDEVLSIRVDDLCVVDGGDAIVLTLPHRKTEQFGGVKPFKMHKLPPHEAFLCPVRAIAYWVKAYGTTTGYLFPPFASRDRPRSGDRAMTSEVFLRLFRRNLLEVKRNPTPYGTHSFRRGGCQYFATELRWPLRRICDWGGWSMNLSHMTIVKYLISWNDDPLEPRDDYLNPNRPPTVRCYACGRSCHCG